jgi:hypothetical protein
MSLVQKIKENKKDFYAGHIFHERQMNSCPIGCAGCAVSASTNAVGAMSYASINELYRDAKSFNVELQITKVEGYDPVFVNYRDDSSVPFAQTVKDAIDLGHNIITPVCTTGSWKADRTKWQLEELGKLGNEYRFYRYPSGNHGVGYALSVPREIRPFANGKYNFDEHLAKLSEDIELLTINGKIDVLIYFNSKVSDDKKIASDIKTTLESKMPLKTAPKVNLIVTDFNDQTLPESCFRYPNSILVSDKGFTLIDPVTMEWELDPNLVSQSQIALRKLANVK